MTSFALTSGQIADLKHLLVQRQKMLEHTLNIELHVDDPSHVSVTGTSDADWAAADADSDVLLAKAERDAKELSATRLALEKIAEDRYGTCEACNASIGYQRLLAYPGARRCLSCQEKTEAQRRP